MRRMLFVWLLVSIQPAGSLLFAQAQAPAAEPLSASQIKSMAHAGISDAQMIALIQQAPAGYALSAMELQDLLDARVSDRVIEAMYARKAGASAAAASGARLPPFPAATAEGTVFYARGTSWVPLMEERVSWSQKSSMMTARQYASVGTLKNPLRGSIDNESSKTLLGNPPTVVINVPAGMTIGEFRLVPLTVKKGKRIADLGSAKKEDAAHKSIDYKIDAAQNGQQFKISTPYGFSPGEYGILNSRTVVKDRVGKIYTFQIQ